MSIKKAVELGVKFVVAQVAPDAIKMVAKAGNEFVEKQKSLIKIPDLKDVNINEALQLLKDELNLTPTSAIATPSLAYADESENEVMYSKPRFGSRVYPKSPIKLYYVTQEVIEKSRELLKNTAEEFDTPRVIGVNIYEAREDLEGLGLKINERLEKPNLKFLDNEDGQVTRIKYPNDKKIGSKLKTGERIWLYYVNEEVIIASRTLQENKVKIKQEKVDKFVKATKERTNGIRKGVGDTSHKIARNIEKPFTKKIKNLDSSKESTS